MFFWGDLFLMWFTKGVKELQGEAGVAVYFQIGIYTPLILSTVAQPEWHDMNVVMKAAANSHHLCSSPHTCKGNIELPGFLLHRFCHQKRVFSEKEGRKPWSRDGCWKQLARGGQLCFSSADHPEFALPWLHFTTSEPIP